MTVRRPDPKVIRDELIEAGFNHDDIDYNMKPEIKAFMNEVELFGLKLHESTTPEREVAMNIAHAIARDYRARWEEQMQARRVLWRRVRGDDYVPRLSDC